MTLKCAQPSSASASASASAPLGPACLAGYMGLQWVLLPTSFPHMRQAALRRRGTDGVTNDEEDEEEEEEAEWKKGLIEQPKQ